MVISLPLDNVFGILFNFIPVAEDSWSQWGKVVGDWENYSKKKPSLIKVCELGFVAIVKSGFKL